MANTLNPRAAHAPGDQRLLRSLVTYLKKREWTKLEDIPGSDSFVKVQRMETVVEALRIINLVPTSNFQSVVGHWFDGESAQLNPEARDGTWKPLDELRWDSFRMILQQRGSLWFARSVCDAFIVHSLGPTSINNRWHWSYGVQSIISRDPAEWFVAKGDAAQTLGRVRSAEIQRFENPTTRRYSQFNCSAMTGVDIESFESSDTTLFSADLIQKPMHLTIANNMGILINSITCP